MDEAEIRADERLRIAKALHDDEAARLARFDKNWQAEKLWRSVHELLAVDPDTLEPVPCDAFVYWWDSEYEGNCKLAKEHAGPHFDGLSWYDDEMNEADAPSAQTPTKIRTGVPSSS